MASTEKIESSHTKKRKRLPLWTKGGTLQLVAALLWIPQAWFLAQAIGAMAVELAIWETAVMAAVWIVVLGVVRTVLDACGSRLAFLSARQTLSRLRSKALQALNRHSPLDTARPTSGAAASILTEQAEMIVPYLSRYQPVQLKVMVVPGVILLAVLVHSWLAALVLLCAAPLIPVFMVLIGLGAKKASQQQMLEIGQMNGFLLDRLRGLATIRAFDAVDMIASRLRHAADEVKRKTMVVLRIAFLSSAVMELFSALGVAMVAVYIGFHLLGQDVQFGAWTGRLTLAQGMFILLLAPTFFDPLKELSAVWHDRASGVAAVEAMENLQAQGVKLVGQACISCRTDGSVMNRAVLAECDVAVSGALGVSVRDVSFRYPGSSHFVLSHFNLKVQAGEKVALVAPSGLGKSTLLALIAGLLPVEQGSIEVGGVVLDDATADGLRTHIGWISQKPHVFAGTVLQNLTLGRADISAAQVEQAVRASAFQDIASGQLERYLGEGGIGLSGGEVLRLALARAMVTPGLGLLLADEPTAHLDSETAQAVMDGLMAVAAKGVTVIVATHDERLLPYMDKVIRLDAEPAECSHA